MRLSNVCILQWCRFLIQNKDRILDDNERSMHQKLEDMQHRASVDHKVAKSLLDPQNDLKAVKIHDFRRYMESPGIIEYCAYDILAKLNVPKTSQGM